MKVTLPMTPAQAAARAGVGLPTIYAEIAAGRLRARHKRGQVKRWWITEADLEEWARAACLRRASDMGRPDRPRPRRRKAPSAPMSPVDKAAIVVQALALVSALWGYGCAYKDGYGRGYERGQEVAGHA